MQHLGVTLRRRQVLLNYQWPCSVGGTGGWTVCYIGSKSWEGGMASSSAGSRNMVYYWKWVYNDFDTDLNPFLHVSSVAYRRIWYVFFLCFGLHRVCQVLHQSGSYRGLAEPAAGERVCVEAVVYGLQYLFHCISCVLLLISVVIWSLLDFWQLCGTPAIGICCDRSPLLRRCSMLLSSGWSPMVLARLQNRSEGGT